MVDKAKYVRLIVGQLPIKTRWWNAPLALRDFSQSNKQKNSLKESPWFPAFLPRFLALTTFPTFPPNSPHSHPDSPHSHPDSPCSHPHSPRSHHFPHSFAHFPIPAFTNSPKSWWKDDIYWLLKSSCFELFVDGKYGFFETKS